MVFGRSKTHELEKELAYLRGKLEVLEKLQNEKTSKTPTPEDTDESKSPIPERLNKRINKLQAALIEKRIQAIERRLGLSPKEAVQETQDFEQEITQQIELSGGNIDILSALESNPMLKLAINTFLRQYNTSIDDLRRDPSKLITLLEDVLNKLKEKKQESEAKGEPFNPYDPFLFMRK